jgi:hypothetical protein
VDTAGDEDGPGAPTTITVGAGDEAAAGAAADAEALARAQAHRTSSDTSPRLRATQVDVGITWAGANVMCSGVAVCL